MLAVTFTIIYGTMCPVLNPWLVDGMLFHPDKEIYSGGLVTIRNCERAVSNLLLISELPYATALNEGAGVTTRFTVPDHPRHGR